MNKAGNHCKTQLFNWLGKQKIPATLLAQASIGQSVCRGKELIASVRGEKRARNFRKRFFRLYTRVSIYSWTLEITPRELSFLSKKENVHKKPLRIIDNREIKTFSIIHTM